MEERHHGYVVASDTTRSGKTLWKVRVKDDKSPFNGQKLVVASVRNGIHLAQGINVNFAIGTVDDEEGQKVLRAVDVQLDPATPKTHEGQED